MRWATVAVLAAVAAAMAAGLGGCGRSSKGVEAVQAQGPPARPHDPANIHSITVKFDYDFTKTPACSAKTTSKTCVKEFEVYDVSGGRYKLFSIPVPEGAKGFVKGITGQSPARTFEPGTHFLSVTALNAMGIESDTNAAKITVEVKRKDLPAPGGAAPLKQ
jgi:hypothetical protein